MINREKNKLEKCKTFSSLNCYFARHNEHNKLYNKNTLLSSKGKMPKIHTFFLFLFSSVFLFSQKVYAVTKIEGGDITIDSLGKIIKSLASKVQIFGIVLSFIALVVFVIQFIIGDDETKQRRKQTILYTLGGVILLILVPSIINFIIDTLG